MAKLLIISWLKVEV